MGDELTIGQKLARLDQTIQEVTADGRIETTEEVRLFAALDFVEDGRLTTTDFKGIDATRFTQYVDVLQKHGFNLVQKIVLSEIHIRPFQEYQPPDATEKIQFGDPFFEEYFTAHPDSTAIQRACCRVSQNRQKHDVRLMIRDMEKFRRDVLDVAKTLGVDAERIATLSTHDAILLAGQITRHQLSYDHAMIGEEEKRFDHTLKTSPNQAVAELFLDAFTGAERPTSVEAKRIDALPLDVLFAEGKGICRNYAPVNAAVFNVLKAMNPRLRNTSMTTYSPEDLGHLLALPHAWNLVTTLTAQGAEVTFVDPTWLDTRSKTARNDPTKRDTVVDDNSMYNAYDPAHFGPEQYFALEYSAALFENAASERRPKLGTPYGTSDGVLRRYRDRAFALRMTLARTQFALSQRKDFSEQRRDYFASCAAENFLRAIGNLMEVGIVSLLLEYSAEDCGYRATAAQVQLIQDLYREMATQVPQLLTQPIRVGYDARRVTIQSVIDRLR